MLRRDVRKSFSSCNGFGKQYFTHLGRGFLPLLAVILLVAPSLAFANGLTVTINPNSLDLLERATGGMETGMYTVVLDTESDQTVVVKVVGEVNNSGNVVVRGSNGQIILTVTPGMQTFDPGETSKLFTVTASDDLDGVNERVTLTHTATIGNDVMALRDATVRVFVEDPDIQGVTISGDTAGVVTVPEAEMATTYSVRLDTRPTGTVTVDVGGATGEISVSPSRLVFTPDPDDNYSTPQPVMVSAGRDFDAEDDSAILTHRVSGADYNTVRPRSLDVTVTDSEKTKRRIEVSTGSMPVAAGTSGVFTIKLDTQPKGTVVVRAEKRTTTENNQVRVTPPTVSFSARDWNRPKEVTVTATSRANEDEGTEPRERTVIIDLSVVTEGVRNRDVDYLSSHLSTPTVTVSIQARLPATRIVLSSRSLTLRERSAETYTVRLSRNPVDPVDVHFRSTDTAVTLMPSSPIMFTAENWDERQTVTVSTDQDEDAVEERVAVQHRWSLNGPVVGTVTVNIDELDTRGVTVSRTDLEIGEGAVASDTYTIALESTPANGETVTVTISSSSADVIVSPSQLNFTTGGAAEQVTVTAIEDADAEPNASATLTHTVRGADYDSERVDRVNVTVREEDTHGIVTAPDALTNLMEGGNGEYMVRLNSKPTGTVTIQLRSDSNDLTVRPSQLKFTAGDWNIDQTVRVTAEHDDDGENDPVVTITHRASGGGYNGVSKNVTVTVMDDDLDEKGVRVIRGSLTISEGGPEDNYTLALQTEPTGTVSVRVEIPADHASRIRVNPSSLTFTQSNWSTSRTIRIRAPEDDIDYANETVTLGHMIRGGGYDAEMAEVNVRILDNDTAALVVNPTSLEIVRSSHQDYTVALATEPMGVVTVGVSTVEGSEATPSPTSLRFTPSNWSSPKRVRVQADAIDSDAPVVLRNSVTASPDDTTYQSSVPTVDVMVVVKGTGKGVAVSPTTLTIEEGESKSYTVILTAEPSDSVRVAISGAEDDVRVNRSSLSFSTSNWNTPQSVRVTVSEDDDARDDRPVILQHEVTSEDGEYNTETASEVTVTPKDDDQEGVLVSPTSLTVAAGSSGTYRIRLNSRPTSEVTVRVDDPAIEAVTVEGPPLIFTESDWRREQTVTVKVDAEGGADEEQTVTLTHTTSGGNGYPERSDIPFVTVRIPVEGVPSAPTGLTASAGDGRATLRWSAPSRDGGSAITRYEYRFREDGGSYGGWRAASSSTSATVTGLDSGTTYEFQVRARNDIGPGPESNTASATLAESVPGAPTGLTATGGDGRVTLTWGAPADSGSQILRYEYRYAASGETYSDWETVPDGGSARRVTIPGLTNGTEYGFQVRAVNTIGAGDAASDGATPGRAPSMPTGLAARPESETITVMWGMPADNGGSAITDYQVRYRMNGGQWSNWMTVSGGANATSYTMTDLTNGIGHEIEVRAVNAIGSGASATIEATPMAAIDFAHFANGQSSGVTITSDIVLVNVETSAVTPAIYFYNQMGDMIDADSVVDVSGDLEVAGDGALTVHMGIPGRGEITISTNGEGALVTGSVRVFGTGRMGGVLRFDIPAVGVAGVGASEPVSDAIFPARRMARGINTGVAIRNLGAEPLTVTCNLMQGGEVMDTATGELVGDGHISLFIDEIFPGSNTTDFVGSVRCTGADGGMFVGVALEMDAANGIFTTLPLVPLDTGSDSGDSMLNFAHFANGEFGGTATSSDLVFVNVATSAVSPAIYFYDQDGEMIAADMVVDTTMAGVDVGSDGALMVMDEIPPMGEMTISTSGMGDGMVGSVRVVSDGPIGGVLRFDIPTIGVAGVGASEAVNVAVFPARRMVDGINTGAAIRNLMADRTTVICRLMAGGQTMGEAPIPLAGNGQSSMFINEIFPNANTDDFEGSVRCTAPSGSMFTGVALEMDFNNRIFTTLPVVPVQ